VSASFSTDALLTLGMNDSVSVSVRLVMLAAERADRSGLAIFDEGELRELFADEAGKPASSTAIGTILHVSVKSGLILPGATAEEIRLDTALVQPEGFPEVGAVYGDLTLVSHVSGTRWLAKCACGSVRKYAIKYLEAGITTQCAGTNRHHRPKTTTY
jgi:hypothetical protein